MKISELQKSIHENAVAHGWWENGDRNFGEVIALCHSELSEALEEYRAGRKIDQMYYSMEDKPEGIPVELADCVIRILDFCGRHEIDLESVIQVKHEYNKTRPYKHGHKVI